MKIIESVDDSSLSIKHVTETVEIEIKKGILGILAAVLDASLLGSMLSGTDVLRVGEGKIRAGQEFSCCLIVNFEIKKCYKNEPKFKGVFSRNNLTKPKYGAYLITLITIN